MIVGKRRSFISMSVPRVPFFTCEISSGNCLNGSVLLLPTRSALVLQNTIRFSGVASLRAGCRYAFGLLARNIPATFHLTLLRGPTFCDCKHASQRPRGPIVAPVIIAQVVAASSAEVFPCASLLQVRLSSPEKSGPRGVVCSTQLPQGIYARSHFPSPCSRHGPRRAATKDGLLAWGLGPLGQCVTSALLMRYLVRYLVRYPVRYPPLYWRTR